jgi:hypothetical protein
MTQMHPTTQPKTTQPQWIRAFDRMAMATFPLVARQLGYTFRTGRDAALEADAKAVFTAVYAPEGGLPPAELVAFGQRYDDAATWIVAYYRGKPIGVKALLDVRVASVALDVTETQLPPHWNAEQVREISRLAILRSHRGGRGVVMVGLLREMLHAARSEAVTTLLAGADRKLFHVYARYNPTARIVHFPLVAPKPLARAYFHHARSHSPDPVLFAFDVAGASPWAIFQRFLTGQLRRKAPAAVAQAEMWS